MRREGPITDVQQAAHKLGVRSRAELIRLVRALGASGTQAYDEELDEGSQTKRE